MIVLVRLVLNRTVVDSDWRFDNLCGSHFQSQSDWRWQPHRLSKRQSLSTPALFRTTFTRTIMPAPRTFWVQTFHNMTSLDKDSLFISSSTQMFAFLPSCIKMELFDKGPPATRFIADATTYKVTVNYFNSLLWAFSWAFYTIPLRRFKISLYWPFPRLLVNTVWKKNQKEKLQHFFLSGLPHLGKQ